MGRLRADDTYDGVLMPSCVMFFGSQAAAAAPTATPGFIKRIPRGRFKVEDEDEKLARRIREGTVKAPPAPQPQEEVIAAIDPAAEKSLRLAAQIAQLHAEAEKYRKDIAKLERKRETEKVKGQLLRAQQALLLASVHEAVLIEEMEMNDLAVIIPLAIRMVLH